MRYVMVSDKQMRYIKNTVVPKIEEETGADIQVNEKNGNAEIKHKNSITEMRISQTIKAIRLEFKFKIASKLYKNDAYRFEIINIKDRTRNVKEFKRQKGRIIGENGKTKRVISDLADVDINIEENYIGIIGEISDVLKARESIIRLLKGSPHANVYADLESYQEQKNRNIVTYSRISDQEE